MARVGQTFGKGPEVGGGIQIAEVELQELRREEGR